MADQVTVARTPETEADKIRAFVTNKIDAAIEEANNAQAELSQVPPPGPHDWEVLAWGPWQSPNSYADPGGIIFLGERAYIWTAVFMTAAMARDVGGFAGQVQLSYHTSNTQRMVPVPTLSRTVCLKVNPGQRYYLDVWEFEPSEAACLYETNICARICNCEKKTVPGYAAFVRHVFDYDPEHLGLLPSPTPGWQFDHPIRYMVADPNTDCGCP